MLIAYIGWLIVLNFLFTDNYGDQEFGDDNLAEINIKMSESARTDDPHKTAHVNNPVLGNSGPYS